MFVLALCATNLSTVHTSFSGLRFCGNETQQQEGNFDKFPAITNGKRAPSNQVSNCPNTGDGILPAPDICAYGCQANGALVASVLNRHRLALFSQREEVCAVQNARISVHDQTSVEELITPAVNSGLCADDHVHARTSAKKMRSHMRERIQKLRQQHEFALQFNQENARRLRIRRIVDEGYGDNNPHKQTTSASRLAR